MAPNLLLKAGFVRGDYEAIEGVAKCRTDFILQNCYSHFIGNSTNFKPMSSMNSKEDYVLMVFKSLIEEYRNSYTSPIQEMARKMKDVSMDLLPQLLRSVSAELFCEGINWSKIIGFVVFVGELGVQHVSDDQSDDLINKLYESFCRHVKETLLSWVEEHGSWEGVECLIVKKDSSDQGWCKNFATGAFRVVGTLFQLASPHVHSYA